MVQRAVVVRSARVCAAARIRTIHATTGMGCTRSRIDESRDDQQTFGTRST